MKHGSYDEYIDVHESLLPYADVVRFFEELERNGDVKSYCNGSNIAGRWLFQIYNKEFIEELASIVTKSLATTESHGTVLEVMSGDGRLTEFLQPYIQSRIIATDAKDGRYNIAYPKWVEPLDAIESVKRYRPSFILISWEPYLSMAGLDIVAMGIPTAWIGNPKMCGHSDLFDIPHMPLKSGYALSRHDSILRRDFKTDVFLFNCSPDIIKPGQR
jgi:hypothetical protein